MTTTNKIGFALLSFLLATAACGVDSADDDDAWDDSQEVGDGKADGDTAAVVPPRPAVRYPTDRTFSPITPGVKENLERIALHGDDLQDDVFAKVGDSITVAPQFLNCFAGSNVDLAEHAGLSDTLEHFRAGSAAGGSPWRRASLAAKGGMQAPWALSGTPTHLASEIETIKPRYAIIMYGTNDAASHTIARFGPALLTIVDRLIKRGVVPILSTIPPNRKSSAVNADVPFFNAVIRGVAQGRQVPLMDFWKELQPLTKNGLSPDGVHPNMFSGGGCKLTADGLKYGYNVRNLLSLESLDRARSAVEGEEAPDADVGPAVTGAGTAAAPFVVDAFPFSDLRSTGDATSRAIDAYPGCNATQNESGPENVYRIDLAAPATLRAAVFDRGEVDVDLHLLSGSLDGGRCVARGDGSLRVSLSAGTHYLVVDSFVDAGGRAHSGEYLLVVTKE